MFPRFSAGLLPTAVLLVTASLHAQSYTFSTLAGLPLTEGFADSTGPAAKFARPNGVAFDGAGHLCVTDASNYVIRRITPAGVVSTFAGAPGESGSTDGTGAAARFGAIEGIVVDPSGNLFVADIGNHTIRRITPAGVVTTIAGSPGQSGSADGTGTAARFNGPRGLARETNGNIVVADRSNNTIRRVTPAGVVTTLAGTAGSSGSTDGTGAAARFFVPRGVAVDSANLGRGQGVRRSNYSAFDASRVLYFGCSQRAHLRWKRFHSIVWLEGFESKTRAHCITSSIEATTAKTYSRRSVWPKRSRGSWPKLANATDGDSTPTRSCAITFILRSKPHSRISSTACTGCKGPSRPVSTGSVGSGDRRPPPADRRSVLLDK